MGFIVIIYNKIYYIIYNKYYNYPEALGMRLNNQLKILVDESFFGINKFKRLLDNLNWVSRNISPREEEIERLKKYSRRIDRIINHYSWYTLLYETHGDLLKILESRYCEAEIVNEKKFTTMQSNKYEALSYYGDMDDEYEYVIDIDAKIFKGRTIRDNNVFWSFPFEELQFMD